MSARSISLWLVVAVAVVAAVACAKASEPSGPSCDDRMDRFAAELAPLAQRTGGGMLIPPEITPVESVKGTSLERYGPVLVIGPGESLTLDGERVSSDDELRHRLEAELEMMRINERTDPLYIWADRATPAATVARVVAAAPQGLESRLLLAAPKQTPSPYARELLKNPDVKSFRREIDGVDASQKATLAARKIEKAMGICAPLVKAFGDVAGVEPSRKGPFLVAATPKALRECQCKVADLDLLEYTMLAIIGAFDRRVTWVPAAEARAVLAN